MHELSLCENIIKIIERQAKEQNFTCVEKVSLSVGKTSGASTESLSFCFPMVAKGTVAEGAGLEFVVAEGGELKVWELEVE